MGRVRGKNGLEPFSNKKRSRAYSSRQNMCAQWWDDDIFLNVPDYTPEQTLWAALLCDSIQEALSEVKILIDRHAWTAAVKNKVESYRWILSDRKSCGSIIWVLEQLNYSQMLSRIQGFVREHYREQSPAPPAHIRSLYVARKTRKAATPKAEQRSTSHNPLDSPAPVYAALGSISLPVALLLSCALAMRNLITTSSLDETYVGAHTSESGEPLTLH